MKLKHSLLTLLAAATYPAAPVHATPTETKMTATVSGQYQQSNKDDLVAASSSEVIVGKLSSVQLTAKDLIRFAGDENETTYPAGSELLVVLGFLKPTLAAGESKGSSSGTTVWIIDKNGVPLANVTEYICVRFDFESLIYSGRIDLGTDEEDTRNRFAAKLHLRFPSKGIWMTFRGNCTELYKVTAPNSQGEQRERGNIIFTGDGDGSFDERPWVGRVVAHFLGTNFFNVKE